MSYVAMKQPYLLQIAYDDDPLNPREDYDNFGHMVCWHRRYNLGDKHDFEDTNDLFKRLVLDSVAADTVTRCKGYEDFMEDFEEMEA